MSPVDAWLILAGQTDRFRANSDHRTSAEEHLAALMALSVIADELGLDQQCTVTLNLMRSLRESDTMQLEFREMLQAAQDRKGGRANGA